MPLSPLSAAVKAGAPCAKVGAKSVAVGKTYTCIKSGKKLIWNKGVVLKPVSDIAKPASSPSPSPKPNSSSEQFFGSREQAMAYEKMKKAMVPQPVPQLFIKCLEEF